MSGRRPPIIFKRQSLAYLMQPEPPKKELEPVDPPRVDLDADPERRSIPQTSVPVIDAPPSPSK